MQLVGTCFRADDSLSAIRGTGPPHHAHRGHRRDRFVRPGDGAAVPAGSIGAVLTMIIGLSLMGLTYGPLGTVLSELFPTSVRYTGSSLTFNFAGIFGASLAPYIATWLAKTYGLQYVGYYLSAAAGLTLVGLLAIRETKDEELV